MVSEVSQIRTFEMTQSVSRFIPGEIDDWPANIQDAIFAALERISQREKTPLKIVLSRCAVDYDHPEGHPHRYYVHVIASEIVMADARTIDPRRIVGEMPDEIKRLLH